MLKPRVAANAIDNTPARRHSAAFDRAMWGFAPRYTPPKAADPAKTPAPVAAPAPAPEVASSVSSTTSPTSSR